MAVQKDTTFKFKFSVIMAVYNVEEYIDEAVESILNQTIGFKDNIQIILSDDGSTDKSGEICDKYKALYPDNIVVVHKTNGGPGSARNAALPFIEGRYVNFLDPDDTISADTFQNVYEFFVKNDDKTDFVAIPMYFFGDMNGEHHLNYKFKKGSRIIDLMNDDEDAMQYSEASAFIKHHVAKSQCFDTELVVAEDAQQIIRILINKPFLGVYAKGRYNYRKRGNSLISTGTKKKGWYLDYLKRFTLPSIEYATERFGFVPRFVQNTLMGDLRWRFAEENLPSVLSEDEIKEYKELIYSIVDSFDAKVIADQKRMMAETKLHILCRRGKELRKVYKDDIIYGEDSINWSISKNYFQLCFTDHEDDHVIITARLSLFTTDEPLFEGSYAAVGNEKFEGELIDSTVRRSSIGETVAYWKVIQYKIPIKALCKPKGISFYFTVQGTDVKSVGLAPGIGFPATRSLKSGYCYKKGRVVRLKNEKLIIHKSFFLGHWLMEGALLTELLFSKLLGAKKAIIGRLYNAFYKLTHRKPLWMIMDRLNKAGDNGEALFEHLVKTDFKEADYFFAIAECEDYHRLKKLYGDRVVLYGSTEYKLKFLPVSTIISSHAENYILDPFPGYSEPYRDILQTKKFVFLQHGVTKDDLSGWLNRFNKNISAFITVAQAERDSIINGKYGYSPDKVWLTGFCRFDKLYNDDKRYITIMPTWRRYLMGSINRFTGKWNPGLGFTESTYFKFFNSLINDERIIECAKKNGYTICFMPHPNTITSIDFFDKNDSIRFLSINDSYREIFAQSSLILTDYSSVIFDFAYLRKPVFYTQFDKEEFQKGDHAYVPGYFDYERDGFGEVVYDYESTVKLLCEYMESGCVLKDKYRERIDSFFAFNDANNCQRTLEKILKLK